MSPRPTGLQIRALVAGTDLLVSAAEDGVILAGSDAGWSIELDVADAELFDVAVDSSGTALAVGTGGLVLRRTPTGAWSPLDCRTSQDLTSVEFARGIAIAAGAAGVVVRIQGDGCDRVPSSTRERFRAITSDGALWYAASPSAVHVFDERRERAVWQAPVSGLRSVAWDGTMLWATSIPDVVLTHDKAGWHRRSERASFASEIREPERRVVLDGGWECADGRCVAARDYFGVSRVAEVGGATWVVRDHYLGRLPDDDGEGSSPVFPARWTMIAANEAVYLYGNALHRYDTSWSGVELRLPGRSSQADHFQLLALSGAEGSVLWGAFVSPFVGVGRIDSDGTVRDRIVLDLVPRVVVPLEDELFVAGDGGRYAFVSSSGQPHAGRTSSRESLTAACATEGATWFGGGGNLYVTDGNDVQRIALATPDATLTAVACSSSSLWAALFDGGVERCTRDEGCRWLGRGRADLTAAVALDDERALVFGARGFAAVVDEHGVREQATPMGDRRALAATRSHDRRSVWILVESEGLLVWDLDSDTREHASAR